jgi:nitrite reductase/ring-hydroxylating ferredoxin subunit
MDATIALCQSADLRDGGDAVPFDVEFAIRYQGLVHAYLNRCSHVAMELDYQPNRFFDDTGQWLLCATHGAAYRPDTGACGGGPCRGGLVKIDLTEHDGVVHWHTAFNLKPVAF